MIETVYTYLTTDWFFCILAFLIGLGFAVANFRFDKD